MSQETLVRENHRNLGPIRIRVTKRSQGWSQSVRLGGCGVRMLETFPPKGIQNKVGVGSKFRLGHMAFKVSAQ